LGHGPKDLLSRGLVIVIAMAIVALFVAARRWATLCVIEIHDGAASITQGRLAPRIFSDIGDIARRPKVVRATIRIVRDSGRAAVRATGLSEAQAQQVRNVVGSVPLARLQTGGRRH
jgi:hypothetical protein